MEQNLQKLYNTLLLIETKGESTKIMGECLKFTEQMITEVHEANEKANKSKEASEEV